MAAAISKALALLVLVGAMGLGAWWYGKTQITPAAATVTAQAFPALAILKPVTEPTIILTTWASWCGVCMAEMPKKLAYVQTRPHIALVALNTDTNPNARNAALKKLNPPPLKNVYWFNDPSRTLAFGVLQGSGVPETFVLNHNRQLLIKQSGPINLEFGAIHAALAAAQP